MKITNFSIKRPITIIIAIFAVVLLGLFSIINISMDLMPPFKYPSFMLMSTYPMANANQVDEKLTKPLEDAMSSVSGVTGVQSISKDNVSILMLEFEYSVNKETLKVDIQKAVDNIKSELPTDSSEPIVSELDINAQPIMSIAISSTVKDKNQIQDYLINTVKPKIDKLNDVSSSDIYGESLSEVLITANPEILSSYGISYNQLVLSLQAMGTSIPMGNVYQDGIKLFINKQKDYNDLQELKDLELPTTKGIVKLKDLANIELVTQESEVISRFNGNDNLTLSIYKKANSNIMKLVDSVKKEISNLNSQNSDYNINIVNDQGEFINNSINSLWGNLILGGILAIIILLVFLRNLKSAFIIIISIPLSLIFALGLMYVTGITLNVVSLGGMAIGVGMVVDNAIVVLESVFKCKEEGMDAKKAALVGTKLVGSAVIASTLTTVAVFLPVIFVEGFAKEIFSQLSLTVTFSLFASVLSSLTLIPLMAYKLNKKEKEKVKKQNIFNRIVNGIGFVLSKLEQIYGKLINFVIKYKKSVICACLILVLATIPIANFIGFEFMPEVDQKRIDISVVTPENFTSEQIKGKAIEVENVILQNSNIDKVYTTIGNTSGFGPSNSNIINMVITVKSDEKTPSSKEIANKIKDKLVNITDSKIIVRPIVSMIEGMVQGGGAEVSALVSLTITAPNLEQVEQYTKQVQEIIEKTEGTLNVKNSLKQGVPTVKLKVDDKKAIMYGLSSMDIIRQVSGYINQKQIGTVNVDGKVLNLNMVINNSKVSTDELLNMKLNNSLGKTVELSQVANLTTENSYDEITRSDKLPFATITADVDGRDGGNVNKEIMNKIKSLNLPDEVNITTGGQQKFLMDSFSGLILALIISIFIVYAVMAIQFGSFKNPLVIMLTIPFAFTGCMLMLLITGFSLNVSSFIGAIMIIGLVVNNAIVLIDRITQLKNSGLSNNEAVITAGISRLRPILMTALTTIFGLLPLLFVSGQGSEIMAPMAAVVVGGMISSTVLTLLVIPAVYCLFNKEK